MQQNIKQTLEKFSYEHFKILVYQNNRYLILFSQEKLIIFTGEMLDVIQTIRNFPSNIKTITTSVQHGLIFVFLENNEIHVFQPELGGGLLYLQGQKDKIYWKKIHNQTIYDFKAIDGYVSFDDQYLITCSQEKINIFRIEQDFKTDSIVGNLKSIFTLETGFNISNVKFSTDSRYFALKGKTSYNIFVYDFLHILKQDKGTYTKEECKNIKYSELSHNEEIIIYRFRESVKKQNVNQCPNTLLTLDKNMVLRLWQESIDFNPQILTEEEQQQQLQKQQDPVDTFFMLISLKLNDFVFDDISIINCSFIYFQDDISKADIEHNYLENMEKRKYGNYELDPYTSQDYISVFQENKFIQIYKITGLRNYGKISKIEHYLTINNQKLMTNIKKISYIMQKREGNNENLELYGWDPLNNLVKMQYNLKNIDYNNNDNGQQSSFARNNIKITYSSKFSFSKIIDAAYDDLFSNICIFTDRNQLIIQKNYPSQNIMPSQHRGLFRSTESVLVNLPDNFMDFSLIKKVFFHNKLIYIFPKCLSYIIVLQISNNNSCSLTYMETISLEDVMSQILGFSYSQRDKNNYQYEVHSLEFNKTDSSQLFYFALKINNYIVIQKIEFVFSNILITKISSQVQEQKEGQQKLCKLDYLNQYNLENSDVISKFYEFNSQNNSLLLLTSTPFQLDISILQDNSISLQNSIKKSSGNIKDIGYISIIPSIVYVITEDNELHFHKENGEILCKFILKQFLALVNNDLFDIRDTRMNIKHLYEKNFILLIENYMLIFNINFDQQSQQHQINLIKSSQYYNKVYYKRVSRFCDPESFEVFITNNKNIILKMSEKIKFINCKFNSSLLELSNIDTKNLKQNSFLPSTIHSKILDSFQKFPHHHPNFLLEILSLGNFRGVDFILQKVLQTLRNFKKVSSKFTISLEKLSQMYKDFQEELELGQNSQQPQQKMVITEEEGEELDRLRKQARRESFYAKDNLLTESYIQDKLTNPEDLQHLTVYQILQEVIKDNSKSLGLTSKEIVSFNIILDFMQFQEENSRTLDFYAKLFLLKVQLMQNQRPVQGGNRQQQQGLMTRDIAWAIHSLQKETILQHTVDKVLQDAGPEAISWNLLKRYGVVLWCDNHITIKKYIEDLANNEFKKDRDPKAVAIWYAITGQIRVLAFLYRNSNEPNNKKMYELLNRNFKEERWRSAASKNGMVLLQRKSYEQAVFFFLLGGLIDDALSVIIEKIKDIQLAILVLLLVDQDPEKKQLIRVINTHFIDVGKLTNDPFLSHIGYYLLGQHVKSINTLYEFEYGQDNNGLEFNEQNKKVCYDWPSKFEPHLSSFHPCAITLATKLKDSTQVKRELQEAENKKKGVQTMAQEFFWDDDEDDNNANEDDGETLALVEQKQVHLKLSVEYYLNINMPLLGLLFFKNYEIETNDEIKSMQNKLMQKHIEFLLEEAIMDEDYVEFFKKYNQELDKFQIFFENSINVDQIQEVSKQKITLLNSPKLSIAISLSYDNIGESCVILYKISREIQNQIYLYCCDNQFKALRRYYWTNLIFALQEIDVGLQFIHRYLQQNKLELPKQYHNQLKMIQFIRLSCEIVLDLGLERFENTFKTLNSLTKFAIKEQIFSFIEKISLEDYAGYINKCQKINSKKQKNNKTHKFEDIYKEAFPGSPYSAANFTEEAINSQKISMKTKKKSDLLSDLDNYHQIVEADPQKVTLIKSLFKYLSIKKFIQISKKIKFNYFTEQDDFENDEDFNFSFKNNSSSDFEPEMLSEQNILRVLNGYKKMQKKKFQRVLSSFNQLSQLEILQDICEYLFTKENGYKESTHFMFLDQVIDPVSFTKISKLINIQQLFQKMKLRIHLHIFKNLRNKLKFEQIEKEKTNIIKEGVELFKLPKSETLKCFTLQRFMNSFTLCTVLTNKGFRHFDLIKNLLSKTRSQDGCVLLEESTIQNTHSQSQTYLTQKQLLKSAQNQPYSVNIIARLLINEDIKGESQETISLNRNAYTEIQTYKVSEVNELLKFSSIKQGQEFGELNCITSHPNLPLIFTGGTKYSVDILGTKDEKEFQHQNNSVCTCVGELSFGGQGSNEYIENLKFNCYGDKLGGISNLGNLYIWKMNKSFKKPIFTIQNQKLNDFSFLNEGSVIAIVGDKTFQIIDTIMPFCDSIVNEQYSGNALHFMKVQYKLLIINNKKQSIMVYDVRKNCVLQCIDLQAQVTQYLQASNINSTEQVTQSQNLLQSEKQNNYQITVTQLSKSENGLIVGYDNNLVRIFETEEFKLIKEIRPFQKSNDATQKQKIAVTQLLEEQHVLFASSDTGIISAAYICIN